MAIEFTESAGRHGFTIEDALHAMNNPRLYEPEFDETRVDHRGKPHLWVGPSRTPAVPLIEVMAEIIPPDTVRIFHVLHARQKFLDHLDKNEGEEAQ